MLFYHFDMLDNYIKSDLRNNIEIEKENIEEIIKLYENKKSDFLAITTNVVEVTDSINKKKLENFYDTISSLKKIFEEINCIQSFASQIKKDLEETLTLYQTNIDNNKDEIKANLVEYNKQRDELFNKILRFENMSSTVLNSAIALSLKVSNKKAKKTHPFVNYATIHNKARIDVELEPHDYNTLIISEKDQKAYLPFFYSEVKDIFQKSNGKYQTLQDVINDLYILPLSQFKNSSIARFRESFHLIREKEKGSITKALDLGLELMFQYELNPIIIAACRNLDELDIYLDCLEEDELYDFACFEILFEVMPQLAKNK